MTSENTPASGRMGDGNLLDQVRPAVPADDVATGPASSSAPPAPAPKASDTGLPPDAGTAASSYYFWGHGAGRHVRFPDDPTMFVPWSASERRGGRRWGSGWDTRAAHLRVCLGLSPRDVRKHLEQEGYDAGSDVHKLVDNGKRSLRRHDRCPHC